MMNCVPFAARSLAGSGEWAVAVVAFATLSYLPSFSGGL